MDTDRHAPASPPGRWRREVRRALPHADDDFVDELAQDLAERWRDARRTGSDNDADAVVRAELAAWTSRSLRTRRGRPAAGWITEIRLAARSAALRPGLALGVIILTAIATAAIVSSFAIFYGLLWRPLPFPASDRLAALWQIRQGQESQISQPDLHDLGAAPTFDAVSAIGGGRGSLRVGDRIERVNLIQLEWQGFEMLGARPILGRPLGPDDAGQPHALISHRLWQGHLGGDPEILRRGLWLSGTTYSVVGVLPPGFDFELPVGGVFRRDDNDIWMLIDPADALANRRDVWSNEAIVRLRPGVSWHTAQAAIDDVTRRLADAYPATNADSRFRVVPLADTIVAEYRQSLHIAGLAAALTLVLALANLVTLVSVRLSERRQELAIREALGAGTWRLRRQLFTEQALVVLTGTVIGAAAAGQIVAALLASEAAALPRADAVRFDGPVLIAAAATAATILLTLTLVPAGRGRRDAAAAGARIAGGTGRTRRLLVASQLALALALASSGALLGLSLVRLLAVDPGFATRGVVVMRVSAYAANYPEKSDVEAFFERVTQRLATLPGAESVAAGSSVPLSGQASTTSVVVEGRPESASTRESAGWQYVTPGYFETLGLSLSRGRPFTLDDRQHDRHVTIINDELAHRLFGEADPLGRRIAFGDGDRSGDWHEIVGVVGDVRHQALSRVPEPRAYDLFGQHWGRTLYVALATPLIDESALLEPARRAIGALDPEVAVFEGASMAELSRRSAAPHRLSAVLAFGLAAAAVLLALAGVYAIAAVSVAERRRETGVRAALGATPDELMRLVFREQAITAMAGLLAGVACAVGAWRLLASQLFSLAPDDAFALSRSRCGCRRWRRYCRRRGAPRPPTLWRRSARTDSRSSAS